MSSIQQNLLATVIHCSTTKELLDTLTSMFISQSQARIMPLKMQIQTLKKGSMSMIDYFAKMKRLSDSLALAGKPVELSDFVQYVLTGLDSSDYESLVTSVLARGDKINLDEFYSLLLSHENRVEQKRGKIASDVTHNLSANMAQKQFNSGKNAGGNPRYNNNGTYGGGVYGNFANGNGMGQSGDGNSTIVCQICFVPGHGAHKCKNRYNSAFVPSRNQARGNFNGNFRAGQRNFGRGFGNSGGRFFNGAYGRGFNSQFGNVFTNHNAGNFNLPRGPGYQSYVMCSDPAAFYVTQPSSSTGASSSASGFGFTGDYSGCSPSAPTVPTPEMVEDPTWYIDSGATNHITNDAGKLLEPKSYSGSEKLLVGNGSSLHIKQVGSVLLDTTTSEPLLLSHVLYVPQITKNLLSVSKLLADNNATIEFLENCCFVKARSLGTILLKGIAKGGLYQVQIASQSSDDSPVLFCQSSVNHFESMFAYFPSLSCNGSVVQNNPSLVSNNSCKSALIANTSTADINLLHKRLGHPAFHTLKNVLKDCTDFSLNKIKHLSFCNACQFGKSHLLHFDSVPTKTVEPLQLLYADLWGPSHVTSTQGYSYYLSILDDFSRFTWIFPLTAKSDALQVFINFKNFIEKHLHRHIKTVQTDWGGEFRSFSIYLDQFGIQF